ncbi:MAG: hypothetical protein C4584_00710 [Armatimonadetes bacterium]|nr:MAG: hypothetical protein C4584_00710 [Armatimonadota bacterium]
MSTPYHSRYYTYIKPVITNPLVKSTAPYIFSFITMTIFIAFVIRPTLSTISQLQKNIETSQQTLDALNQKYQNLSLGRQNLQKMSSQTKQKIATALPDQSEVTALIKHLHQAMGDNASASALQIQPVIIVDNTKKRGDNFSVSEISFSFSIPGSYYQLISTLYNLDKSPRIISINNAVISRQEGGSQVLSVTGKAYFLK